MGPSALTAPAATIQCQTHQLGALSRHTQRKQPDILAAETRQIALSTRAQASTTTKARL